MFLDFFFGGGDVEKIPRAYRGIEVARKETHGANNYQGRKINNRGGASKPRSSPSGNKSARVRRAAR